MTHMRFAWRDRVADPRWLVWCSCGHAEQHHTANGCTVLGTSGRCICEGLHEKSRVWCGPPSERPV